MSVSNKTTQEQQKQARLKIQLLFFEKIGSTIQASTASTYRHQQHQHF